MDLGLRGARMPAANRLVLVLAVALLLPTARAQQVPAPGTAFVYKPDGTRHCDRDPGVSLEAMAKELAEHGIRVHAQRKAYDGSEGVALCGRPTGSINVFEIAESDRMRALGMGYRPAHPGWLAPAAR